MSKAAVVGAVAVMLVACRSRAGDPAPHARAELIRAVTTNAELRSSDEDVATRGAVIVNGEREQTAEQPLPEVPSYRKHAGVERPRSQQVACGELGFVRLLPKGFEGYAYYSLSIMFRSDKRTFTHAIAQAGHSYLLLGPKESLAYYQPNTNVQPLARLPALGPFEVWPDVRRREWVWVHYLRDDAVHRFTLPPHVFADVETSRSEGKATLLETLPLSQFDGRALERSFSGEWLYSRKQHDQESSDEANPLLISGVGATGVAYAYESSVRVWANSGKVNDVVSIALDGYPFNMVSSEARLALITHHTRADARVWQLEVIASASKAHRVTLPNSSTAAQVNAGGAFGREVANRSLCLVPGKPWVVVGGKTAVRVIDYTTGHTLLVRDG